VFTQLGRSGGCTLPQFEAVSLLISLVLCSGVDQQEIIDQLKGMRCPSPTPMDGGIVSSFADGIAKAFEAC
jgi:ribonucleoside-diphosphate reductase alpha chain